MGDAQLDALIRRVSNWDRWGAEDERGTVNLITPERRRHAASLVRKGAVFSLAMPFDLDGVPQQAVTRRINPHHWMLQTGTDLRAGCQAGAQGRILGRAGDGGDRGHRRARRQGGLAFRGPGAG